MTRILMVDDSRLTRSAVQRVLGREFDVVAADDGAEAWAMLERDTSIQVVFTDLAMPRMDGYELLRLIRTATDNGIRNLPVIVVTGVEDDETARVQALNLGATDFITKPFTAIDLVARARAHAAYQRINQQLRAQTTLDPLTGLANKAGFLERLEQDAAYARRHRQQFVLARVDIDDFRGLFLKLGKEVAERLLIHVSRTLRSGVRTEDTVGRVGLGGFALSLPGSELQGIAAMIERIRAEVAVQVPAIVGKPLHVALSAGLLMPSMEAAWSAQGALDQCQAKLDRARDAAAQPGPAPLPQPAPSLRPQAPPPQPATSPRLHAPSPRPQALPLAHVAAEQAASPRTRVASEQPSPPVRLDAILEQIERGNSHAVIGVLAQVLDRLLPLLRLLSSSQRAQLIRILQQLPDYQPRVSTVPE